jgi:hypothetical protein
MLIAPFIGAYPANVKRIGVLLWVVLLAGSGASGSALAGARVPARFTLGPGGRLSPPAVYVPAHIPVEVTVVSHDRRAHRVRVAQRLLTVAADGRASMLIRALPVGSYRIRVDGVTRGVLHIGGAPGP